MFFYDQLEYKHMKTNEMAARKSYFSCCKEVEGVEGRRMM
jgi:hypothetical protein